MTPSTMASETMTMNANFLCPITQAVMEDPVIGSDGITYERTAIEAWFAAGHSTSPMTRVPMTAANLVPNYALKAMIQEQKGMAAPAAPAAVPAPAAIPTILPTVDVERVDATTYHVTLTMPDDRDATLPTTFIDVLDRSGSMGSPSTDQRGTDAAAFSRADLVRHSVATQIELLRPRDELALVLFDDRVEVPLEPTRMTPIGRAAATACLPLINARGGTNIWQGLQRALQIALTVPQGRNVVILLQTDGESDPNYNPPRGIAETFRAWRDSHPGASLTVHTIGYGYGRALDTPLLREIAAVGAGTVNYIPDGSMVGTVFIHLLANLMSAAYTNLSLQIPEAGEHQHVGFIQAGQRRTFLLKSTESTCTVALKSGPNVLVTKDITDLPITTSAIESCGSRQHPHWSLDVDTRDRLGLIHELKRGLAAAEQGTFDTALIPNMLLAVQSTSPLVTDIADPDPSKGQIAKAFTPAAFERWGRHYIPCVICSHENEWAINFKDATSTIYGTPTTRAAIKRGDGLFNNLPPPKSTYNTGAAPLMSMASVNSAAGPCFLGASLMKMADGSLKRCDQVRAGDIEIGGARIQCVIKTLVPFADVVRLGSNRWGVGQSSAVGGFTLWHPVFVNDSWQFPANVGPVERVTTDAIYNFVLITPNPEDNTGVIIVDEVMTVTMGHSVVAPITRHPYFGAREEGKRNILDDLQEDPGWSKGYIVWSNLHVERDPATGFVCKMTAAVPHT